MYILYDLVRSPIRGRLGEDGGEGVAPTSCFSFTLSSRLPSRAARAFLSTSATLDPNFSKISALSCSRSSSVVSTRRACVIPSVYEDTSSTTLLDSSTRLLLSDVRVETTQKDEFRIHGGDSAPIRTFLLYPIEISHKDSPRWLHHPHRHCRSICQQAQCAKSSCQ